MKNKKFLFLLLLTFTIKSSFAQLKEIYEKGSITKNDGQTISGFIKNDDFKHKITSICFKTSLSNNTCLKYDTSQIISFKTERGEIYNLFNIKINNLSKDVTLFAKKLVDGKTSLYKSLSNEMIFYIVKKGNKNYVLQKDRLKSGEVKIERYNYPGILNQITEDFSIKTKNEVKFKEQYFIDRISSYNESKGNEYKIIKTTEKPVKFLTFSSGLGFGKNKGSEYFLQLNKRIYYPNFSRNTSLNIGLNYYNYQFTEPKSFGSDIEVTQTLVSVPFQFQYNLAHKSTRPYIFSGVNIAFFNKKDQNKNSLIDKKGFQENFGFSFLFGAGLEIDIAKNIFFKGEFRHETFNHLFLFGLGYVFKLPKKTNIESTF
jgi:hypothetical protein